MLLDIQFLSLNSSFLQFILTVSLFAVDSPTVIGQPTSHLSVVPGQSVSFAVIATGYNLMYQWQKDGVNITTGANSTAYIIQIVTDSDEGEYQCVVSNVADMVTSNAAILTVCK